MAGGVFKDKVGFKDGVSVSLDAKVVAPVHPCPECEAETKEHHPILDDDGEVVTERRICSKLTCREVIEL